MLRVFPQLYVNGLRHHNYHSDDLTHTIITKPLINDVDIRIVNFYVTVEIYYIYSWNKIVTLFFCLFYYFMRRSNKRCKRLFISVTFFFPKIYSFDICGIYGINRKSLLRV